MSVEREPTAIVLHGARGGRRSDPAKGVTAPADRPAFVTELWQSRSLRDAGPTRKRSQPIGQRSGTGENPPATMRTGAPLPSAGTDHTSVAAPDPVGSP